MRRVRPGPHLVVIANDPRLGAASLVKLERIAARYFKATGRRLTITGGRRSSERQAELMREKLAHGEDLNKLYDAVPAAEIKAAYVDGVARKLSKKRLIRA